MTTSNSDYPFDASPKGFLNVASNDPLKASSAGPRNGPVNCSLGSAHKSPLSPINSLAIPLQEFPSFPKLSTELRLKIWGFAAPEPQIITQLKSTKPKKTHCCRVPAVLRACRESRYEYLADAKSPISKRDHQTYHLVYVKYPVYFSFEIDTLYIVSSAANRHGVGFFDESMVPKLRYLAVDHHWSALATVCHTITHMLTANPNSLNLKLLTAVFHANPYYNWVNSDNIKFQPGGHNMYPFTKFAPNVVTNETKEWYASWFGHDVIRKIPNLAIEHKGVLNSMRFQGA
ncbi:hypothetical protein BGZ57DRAFT_1009688 [Hyaloscypha finlandica]|nr:hypothetical protein BGZ57DRAFT_1009688 [Hyaloscypha finlandica]